jgi:hypothetical protein
VTVYARWPDRLDLIRDAFARYGDMPRHGRTGDLAADLVGELTSFREGMTTHRLDRALVVLVDRAASVPELVEVRDRFVRDGEGPLRDLLATAVDGDLLETSTLMLSGLVVHSVLLHGRAPTDAQIAVAVDLTLSGLPRPGAR